MNKLSLGIISLVSLFLGSLAAHGATLYLKNGRTMEGIIKAQNEEVVQLDIGGGIIAIKRSKIDRIEEGTKEEEVLSEKAQRKVILTRKNAPKDLVPLVYEYNDLRDKLKQVLAYNDEAILITTDRSKLIQRTGSMEKQIRAIDAELGQGQNALGLNRYNALVTRQNAIHAQARKDQEKIRYGRQRLQFVRGALAHFRNELNVFEARVASMQDEEETDDPTVMLFHDELLVRINRIKTQVTGRNITFERQGVHTVVDVKINNRITVPMLVDTGASTITLSKQMATQLGLKINKHNAVDMNIANGEVVRGYHVILDSVSVSGLKANYVLATILDQAPSEEFQGLLGMSYLENFELSLSPKTGLLELRETQF